MSRMTVLSPNTITDSHLLSCTISENDYSVWASGATYGDGGRVIYNHRIYESTAANNIGHNPLTDVSDPPWWVDIGPTNRWACLDNETSTKSTATGAITYVFRPGRFSSLAVVDMQASSIYVKIASDRDGVIYEQTTQIKDASPIPDWYAYYYDPIRAPKELVIEGLPPIGDVTVTVTVTNAYGTTSIGTLVFGWLYEIGLARFGARASIFDYSKKSTDDFGVTTFVRRAFSKRADLNLILNDTEVDYVHTVLSELRATPCLWRASDKYTVLTIFGFYRDFSVDIEYPTHSSCTLTLEGLA